MFKVSIRFTVKIWFGTDAATTPGACSFSRPSTFCNSWRNAFDYNRAVSNRNEFVEKSPCAKYAAAGNNPTLNLGGSGFTEMPIRRSTGRATAAGRLKPGDARGRAEHWFTARETEIAAFEKCKSDTLHCRPNGDDIDFTIRGNPNYRAHAGAAYRRLRD
jgi:hypothetical protein